MNSPPPPTMSALLRRPGPRWLWLGQVASVTGDRLYGVALIWVTFRLTGSPAAVGVVALADTAPFLAASVVSGWIADRGDRLRLARLVDVARALAVAVVPVTYLSGHLSVPVLAAVAAVLSGLEAFFLPALQASLPRLVEPSALTPMVSLLDSTDRLGRVLGPGAIGLLTFIPQIHLFTVDAATFVISAVCVTALRGHVAAPATSSPAHRRPPHWSAELIAGWRVSARAPVLRDALVLRGLCNLAWPAFTLAAPFMISQRFRYGLGAYGLVLGLFGVGNLVGNVFASRITGPALPLWCCRAWALTGIGFAGLAIAPTFPVFAAASAAIGVCTPLANVTINAYIAITVEPDVLARVYTAQRTTVTAAATTGLPIIAVLLSHTSPTTTMLIGGAFIAAAGATALVRLHVRLQAA